MQTRRPLSLVTKKTTTQKQNNTNEFFKLERNNTRKTNKNKNIKHKNQTTLLTNITQKKTPELQGKQPFFQRLKAKQERIIKTKTQNKTKQKHQKPSQHNNKKQKG